MNWRARSRLNAQRTSSNTLSPRQPPSLSWDERRKPPVSCSGSAGGAEGGNKNRDPPSVVPGTLKTPPSSLTSFLANLCSNPCPPQHKHTHTQQKLPRGLPPAAQQGELFKTASLRDSTDETPNTSTFRLFLCYFYSPLRPVNGCVRWSEWRLTEELGLAWREAGLLYLSHRVGWSRTQLVTGAENFFFFRNLVAWFSYLSQYIFTYLLLKWIPLQLMKKNLVNMLWIYIKKILFHADAATGELALWSNRSITLVGLNKVVCFFCLFGFLFFFAFLWSLVTCI